MRKKTTMEKLEDMMAAVAFAEADDRRSALEFLRPEKEHAARKQKRPRKRKIDQRPRLQL
jgi:hypothetical protein